ncbi:hypothetical protein PENTCL1PPCAC_8595, partial [Pristionchus entomophagus]
RLSDDLRRQDGRSVPPVGRRYRGGGGLHERHFQVRSSLGLVHSRVVHTRIHREAHEVEGRSTTRRVHPSELPVQARRLIAR